MTQETFEIRLVTAPGLETVLAEEAREAGFAPQSVEPGGVHLQGTWSTVWAANLRLRGAARVLARIGGFRALHLAQLDKRARKFGWAEVFRKDRPIRIEASCKSSRIYHAGAVKQRIERALQEELGATISDEAEIRLLVRMENDFCSFSVDTSGAPLHQRGHKFAVGKAPMRETLAALFLRQAGFTGHETVVDPMCGSGTFILEAAERAAGLAPGRSRAFAFEQLASFDATTWAELKTEASPKAEPATGFYGSDRDSGVIRMAGQNAERAGVAQMTTFACHAVSDLNPPEGAPGLVICNPPYGARIGNKKALFGLYGALGEVLKTRFGGWRVGVVTSEAGLAKATGLGLKPAGPLVAHGGIKICLYAGAITEV